MVQTNTYYVKTELNCIAVKTLSYIRSIRYQNLDDQDLVVESNDPTGNWNWTWDTKWTFTFREASLRFVMSAGGFVKVIMITRSEKIFHQFIA